MELNGKILLRLVYKHLCAKTNKDIDKNDISLVSYKSYKEELLPNDKYAIRVNFTCSNPSVHYYGPSDSVLIPTNVYIKELRRYNLYNLLK